MSEDNRYDMLTFLLNQFQMHSPNMGGEHCWRFRNGAWPMTHARGPTIEAAIQRAMDEVTRERNETPPSDGI